jgi:hypothetical protein
VNAPAQPIAGSPAVARSPAAAIAALPIAVADNTIAIALAPPRFGPDQRVYLQITHPGSGWFQLYLATATQRVPLQIIDHNSPTRFDITDTALALRSEAEWQLVVVPTANHPGRQEITAIEFLVRDPSDAFAR